MKTILLSIILSTLLNSFVLSQNPQWIVYDSTNSVLKYAQCLAVDSLGTKWIVTGEELVRFDNHSWQVFRYDSAGFYFHNVETSIAIDQNNNKWIGNRGTMGSPGGLYQFDNDNNWTAYMASISGLPDDNIWDIAIDDSATKWIGTENGLAKFDDTNWEVFNIGNSGIPDNKLWCIEIDNLGNKWIGTENGLAKFDDTNWEVFDTTNSVLPGNEIRCLATELNSNIIWIGITISHWPNRQIAIAKFDGINWSIYNSGLPVDLITCLEVDEFGVIWFGSYNGMVKFDGSNWTVYNSGNSGLLGDIINDVAIDGDNNKWIAFSSDYNQHCGLAIFNENGIVSINDKFTFIENIPNDYQLSQNYPNPFNPSTTIEFSLPKSEFTTLKIYNILGKEVSTLVSNKLNQGNHTYQFDGKNLASGIYYYQLFAGDYREVKKMILLR